MGSDSPLNKYLLEGPGSELYSHNWTEFPDVEIAWDYLEDDKAGMITNLVWCEQQAPAIKRYQRSEQQVRI